MPGETVTTRRRFSRTGTSSGPAGQGGSSQNNQGTGSSANQNNQGNQGNNNSQNNNQTGQSGNNQGGQHKLKSQLDKLAAEGKADTEQANVLKRYLSGVVSPHDKSGDKTPFYQKQTLFYKDFQNYLISYYKNPQIHLKVSLHH